MLRPRPLSVGCPVSRQCPGDAAEAAATESQQQIPRPMILFTNPTEDSRSIPPPPPAWSDIPGWAYSAAGSFACDFDIIFT